MRGITRQAGALQEGVWVEVELEDEAGEKAWHWRHLTSRAPAGRGRVRLTFSDETSLLLRPSTPVLFVEEEPTGVPQRRHVPEWDAYFLGIAGAVAARAKCRRRSVGALVVDDEHRILSTGYNGFPSGSTTDCLLGGCPRGLTRSGEIPPDSPYTDPASPGFCSALHAEANCLLFNAGQALRGATMYVTDRPCPDCLRLIAGAGIKRVVWPAGEFDPMAFYNGL